MKMRSVQSLKLFFWIGLYVCFMVFAVIVKQQLESSGAVELWGWDYRTFVSNIQNWGYITYFGFRHPGLGVILSPLVALEHLWPTAYLVFMPGVAVATAYLIFKMAGWGGLIIWLSFPMTWLMSAIPESFPIAQLALAGSLYWFLKNKIEKRDKSCIKLYCALGFSIVNGMITLTNGIKPLLAYLILCRNRNRILAVLIGIFIAIAAGWMFFYVRSILADRDFVKSISATMAWVPAQRCLLQELSGFFIRPVGFVQSLLVYPLLIISFVKFKYFEDKNLILTMGAYFIIDVVIHLVIGWGMMEPWIFAPHWLFMVPVVIGRCLTNAKGRLNCLS